jgi:UDP-glucose 4-epimerase
VSRVLITGGAGMIGATLARSLLADPAFDVRVCDDRDVPLWMREGCEVRSGDLRVPEQARAAVHGCSHVVHLASAPAAVMAGASLAHTRLEHETALHSALVRAALDCEVERLVYVSSPLVFERAELFPTPEDHLAQCPAPRSAAGYGRLTGERLCHAAHEEHGLAFAICRPFATYGPVPIERDEPGVSGVLAQLFAAALASKPPPGLAAKRRRGSAAAAEPRARAADGADTLTPTHVDDVARALVAALASQAALNEDFNIAATDELSVADAARVIWQACGRPGDELAVERAGGAGGEPRRSRPSVDKARELLAWRAQTAFADGAAEVVASLRG